MPGHHRTNFPRTGETAESDPEGEASETQQKRDGGKDTTHEVQERLAADISRHWLGNYTGLKALPGIIGTVMMGVSAAEKVISTAIRMSVLYAWKGPGPWMAAAVWGTAFQMVTMPGRWALEWGRSQGEVVSRAVEARVGGASLLIEGEGQAPTTTSQEQAAGRTWDGSATPAVQWGSVPRRLFYTALQ